MDTPEAHYEYCSDVGQLIKDFFLYLFLLYGVNQEVCIRVMHHHIGNINEAFLLSMIGNVGLCITVGIVNIMEDSSLILTRELQRRVTALLGTAGIGAVEILGVQNIPDIADLPATCIGGLIWYYSGRK